MLPHGVQAKEEHAVLVLVPGLEMEDYFLLLEDKRLAEGVAAGALNRVTAGPLSPVDELLTLSAGARARADEVILQDRITEKKTGNHLCYHLPGFKKVRKENEQGGYGAAPGTLSEMIREHGGAVRFAGHSDRRGQKRGYAPFLAADFQGRICGSREVVVDKNESAPGGWMMNPQKTLEWVDNVQQHTSSSLTVVEWGDLYRTQRAEQDVSGSRALESLMEALRGLKKGNSPLFLMGVDPSTDKMIPFAMWTKESGTSTQRLVSTTTGQPYLGSSVDAASTLAAVFTKHTAAPLIPGETAELADMKKVLRGMQTIHDTRTTVLGPYISVLIVLLAAAFFFRAPRPVMHAAVAAGMASPTAFLLIPALFGRPVDNVFLYTGSIAAAALLIGTITSVLAREKAPLVLSTLLIIIISIDLLNSAQAIQQSYLGYDPLIGARYSGIGNELGGFFAAAAVICLEPVLRYGKKAVLPLILLFLIITGSASLGKNAGVTLASGLMFGTLWMKEFRAAGWKYVWTVAVALVLLLGVLLWGLQFTGGHSHIGAAFQQLLQGEWDELGALLQRKWEMNIKIIFHSSWTKLLIASYAIAAFYMLIETKAMRPSQQLVLKAGAAGSIFLLLLNDSGAVAASTSMFYLLCVRYIWHAQYHVAGR